MARDGCSALCFEVDKNALLLSMPNPPLSPAHKIPHHSNNSLGRFSRRYAPCPKQVCPKKYTSRNVRCQKTIVGCLQKVTRDFLEIFLMRKDSRWGEEAGKSQRKSPSGRQRRRQAAASCRQVRVVGRRTNSGVSETDSERQRSPYFLRSFFSFGDDGVQDVGLVTAMGKKKKKGGGWVI